jgi:hypothetical protein
MLNNAILLQELSIEQLQLLIGSSVKDGIQQFQKEIKSTENSEELLSREQACKFLHIDSSTLWAWTNAGKLKAFGIGSRRYYKKSLIMESLTLLKKK